MVADHVTSILAIFGEDLPFKVPGHLVQLNDIEHNFNTAI